MKLLRILLLASALLGACAPGVEEDMTLELVGESPAMFTLTCSARCEGTANLDLRLSYSDVHRDADEVVELLQYRLEYDFGGLAQDVPFLAGEQRVQVQPGDVEIVSMPLLGERQREALRDQFDPPITGTVTVTLAGYDHNDERVSLQTRVAVRLIGEETGADDD